VTPPSGGGRREVPDWGKTIAELRSLPDDELIAQHDELIVGEFRPGVAVGTNYYLNELSRRVVERQGRILVRLTRVIAALTVVNVAAVILALFVE
jgi:hypothetical protein